MIKSSKDFPENSPRYPPKAIRISEGCESRSSVISTYLSSRPRIFSIVLKCLQMLRFLDVGVCNIF